MRSPYDRKFDRSSLPIPRKGLGYEVFDLLEGENKAIEIGPGVGMHPLIFSKKNPTWSLVAIEHTLTKFEKFQRRFQTHGCPKNLMPIHANAISWVSHYVPDDFLNRVFLLYPNPYPKKSDEKKRWYTQSFIQEIHRCLKRGGLLVMRSNFKWYIDDSIAAIEHPDYFEVHSRRVLSGEDTPQTHFEKKFLEQGLNCFEVIFKAK